MLQTSTTTDSEFNLLLPTEDFDLAPITALSVEDEAFYYSIKAELNSISFSPPQQVVDAIIKYSIAL